MGLFDLRKAGGFLEYVEEAHWAFGVLGKARHIESRKGSVRMDGLMIFIVLT